MCQRAGMSDSDLRALLETLDPKARDNLRRVLIRDQSNRDAIASDLLRYRDKRVDDWLQRLTSLTPVRGQAPRPPVVGAPGLPGRA
jgi:hypothetical protein